MAIVLSMACLAGFTTPLIAGTVVAWGDNTDGQTTVPSGLGGVTAIAGGAYHSLALKSDGTVVAWGNPSSVPGDLSGVTAIAAGGFHSLALKSEAPTAILLSSTSVLVNQPAEVRAVSTRAVVS
jgi:alpha-tubulin suppressor-like RCC1 family protein